MDGPVTRMKVSYTCSPGGHTTGGIIDAGPNVEATLANGVLTLKGPKIDYTVKNVASYRIEKWTDQ